MGNLLATLKKFFTNKNTVTILGILAGVIILWVFYNYRVNQAISPMKVPYALKEITATSEITKDNIGYIEVNSSLLKTAKIITNVNELIGHYISTGTSIPAGGLFYKNQVVVKAELPNSVFDSIPENYTIYQLGVNNASTYANSIYPGDRIDLYLKANEDGKVIYGKLIERIEVLAVRDSQGQNVFDSKSTRTPALLLFAVPDDLYLLLKKAEYISGITINPVPRNKMYTEEAGDTKVTSEVLRDYILARSVVIPDA